MIAPVDPTWLLNAWESGADAPPAARGAVLVHEAGLTPTLDAALDLPVGRLAEKIAQLHTALFGASAEGVLECDGCGELLDVLVPLGPVTDYAAAAIGDAEQDVTLPSGRQVHVRVPTSRDLLAAQACEDVAGALLVCCVSLVADAVDTTAGDPRELGPEDLAAVDATGERLAGAAAVTIRSRCPQCREPLSAPVDVEVFLWDRLAREAPATIADVATLAAAFGWPEDDILRLSPTRRQAYLALLRAGAP